MCLKDVETWKTVSRQVLENIAARTYEVVVPAGDVHTFVGVSPAAFEVAPEESYLEGHTLESIRNALPLSVRDRAGWYLQQLVKLTACSRGADDSVNLIWDGDTVPLRRLRFIDDQGRLRFYASREHHLPYFNAIETLLGLARSVDTSFIAQCMPTRARWVRDMIGEIEARASRPWIDAVLACVSGRDPSEFSEYETLGQFVFQRYPSEAALTQRPWHRFGNSLVGGIDRLTHHEIDTLATDYDFVSFESWDPQRPNVGLRAMIGRLHDRVRRHPHRH